MAAKRSRAKRERHWELHSCGHYVPYDELLGDGRDSEAVQKARVERERAERLKKAQRKCPVCLESAVEFKWDLRRDLQRSDLVDLVSRKSVFHQGGAIRMRRARLKRVDQHLVEWRNLIEAPFRPKRMEGHIQQFKTALLGALALETITDADWWVERRGLELCQLLAEAAEYRHEKNDAEQKAA